MSKPSQQPRFPASMRILHWLNAAMVLSMLFIGVGMVTSLKNYHRLISIHRPLGIAVWVVVIVRYVNRKFSRLPPFSETMSQRERRIAGLYENALYSLMFLMPLVGWGMLSAGSYPIMLVGSLHLPAILPASPILFAILRKAHTLLAYLLFLVFLVHFTLVVYHAVVIRDGILRRML